MDIKTSETEADKHLGLSLRVSAYCQKIMCIVLLQEVNYKYIFV